MDNNTLKLIKEYVDTKVSSNLSGLSAYQVAIKNGFQGTEIEWLASLKGEDRIPANISNKEDISNKVTSLSASSTDTQYPSAKATYDAINARASFDSPALTRTPFRSCCGWWRFGCERNHRRALVLRLIGDNIKAVFYNKFLKLVLI